MKRFLAIFLVIMSLAVATNVSAQLQWREVNHKIVGRSITDPNVTDGVEIFGKDGVITIRTQRRIQVRVLTILGQLISQTTLPAGASELRLGTRGVFIVQVGNVTTKVTL